MADDFEYVVISDPNFKGFFAGPDGSEFDFLSEAVARAAKVARKKELREITHLRGSLGGKRRRGNIAASTYDRGMIILDARQDALERADQPAKSRLPEPLSPYSSPMMDTLPVQPRVTRKPRSGNPNGNPRETPRKDARLRGDSYYLSGKACPAGHWSKRRVSNGGCVACGENWTAANRDAARLHWRESKQRIRERKAQAGFDKPGSICDSPNIVSLEVEREA